MDIVDYSDALKRRADTYEPVVPKSKHKAKKHRTSLQEASTEAKRGLAGGRPKSNSSKAPNTVIEVSVSSPFKRMKTLVTNTTLFICRLRVSFSSPNLYQEAMVL